MEVPPLGRLLAFARELQHAQTFHELLAITQAELSAALGYRQAWLFVVEPENPDELVLLDVGGSVRTAAWEVAPRLRISADPMLAEIVGSDEPVVVHDARTDPRTNKEIVAALGNRTIINMPLRLLDKPLGAFGTGTFGDEGCRSPSRAELDYLIAMGGQVAVAAGRIRFVQERARTEEALRRVEEQLRQAQKMEAVGRLAGGVAHDFNNLLSVILSYGQLLLEDAPPSTELHRDLGEIVRAARRASELTRKLLAFSRQDPVVPRVIDVAEVIAGLESMVRRLIREDICFETALERPLGRVAADPGVIEQVLLNLVVNARDAMEGGGKLLIETANVTLDECYAREHVGVEPGAHVMIAVTDTGCGMDKATQERMFEPFFTTKDRDRGTGLGLSTVYGLVKRSGGSLWVYSELGNGTTVRVYLPVTQAIAEVANERPAEPPKSRGGETILLVEDEEQLRTVAREILERNGYRVLVAAGGEQALALAASIDGAIDLLLTDVIMPGGSGHALAERFAELRPQTAILYTSGYTETSIIRQRGLAAGFALLPKPITPDALLRKVREVLDGARDSAGDVAS